MYALFCYTSVARKFPLNYFLLLIFTLCETVTLSMILLKAEDKNIIVAFILTAVMVVALTIYAWTTKTDFTICGGMMFVLFLILVAAVIMSLVWRDRIS